MLLTAVDIAAPWVYVDSSDIVPGKRYSYTAHVEQNGNPSFESTGKYECAKPAKPDSATLGAIETNNSAIVLQWSIEQGKHPFNNCFE